MGLNRLLRDLKAAGVRHYRAKDGTEVEFFAPGEGPEADDADEARPASVRRRTAAKPEFKDPIKAALEDFPVLTSDEDEETDADEAN